MNYKCCSIYIVFYERPAEMLQLGSEMLQIRLSKNDGSRTMALRFNLEMYCKHSVEILSRRSPFSFRFHPATCGCRVSKLRNFRSRETGTLNDVRRKHRYGLETSSCQVPASYRSYLHVPPTSPPSPGDLNSFSAARRDLLSKQFKKKKRTFYHVYSFKDSLETELRLYY